MSEKPSIRHGCYVTDKDNPNKLMFVVARSHTQARDWWIGDLDATVADVNDDYPPSDIVVVVNYVYEQERTGIRNIGGKHYSFPESRLSLAAAPNEQPTIERGN